MIGITAGAAVLGDVGPPDPPEPGDPHLFWRVTNISVPGSLLEIAELQMLIGPSVVSEGQTYDSETVPNFNFILAIFNGVLSDRCYWDASVVEDPDFWIEVEFGSPVAIDGVRQAGFDTSSRYMDAFTLEYSDDGSTWFEYGSKSGLTYPGNNTLSSIYTFP